ncbi:MAG: hypothetical protein H0X28_16005, partial [Solirubrobacterales bacterium]|nr:hypothetical protein [Solirubrobacterales bacterium]
MTGQSTSSSITPEVLAVGAAGGLSTGRAGLRDGTRPLKRWRYVAIFNEQLAACAALVQIGPLRQSFWALHLREERLERGRTRLLPRRGE